MRIPRVLPFAALLLLCLTGCAVEETPVPTQTPAWDQMYIEQTAQTALPVLEAVCAVEGLSTFEGAPDAPVALCAARAYVNKHGGEGEEWALTQIFAAECPPADESAEIPRILPAAVSIEAVTDSGAGTIIVSVAVNADYGYGMEFAYLCDIHIIPDPKAAFGATVTKVFFPE